MNVILKRLWLKLRIYSDYVKQLKIYINDYEPELSKEMLGKIKEYIGRG